MPVDGTTPPFASAVGIAWSDEGEPVELGLVSAIAVVGPADVLADEDLDALDDLVPSEQDARTKTKSTHVNFLIVSPFK